MEEMEVVVHELMSTRQESLGRHYPPKIITLSMVHALIFLAIETATGKQ